MQPNPSITEADVEEDNTACGGQKSKSRSKKPAINLEYDNEDWPLLPKLDSTWSGLYMESLIWRYVTECYCELASID